MKKSHILPFFLLSILFLCVISVSAQSGCRLLQMDHVAIAGQTSKIGYWSGAMELPFLLISVFFAFATAHALRGGKFGKGMNLLAWGFVVMALGHIHMQIEHFYGVNLFKNIFGEIGGTFVWFVALIVTWGFSGLGFYSILKASKGK
jgi:hypothetical protein